jgi:ribosomal protein S14
MQYQGVLRKMQTELADPIQYYLIFDGDFLNLNQVLNKELTISFLKYQCLNCGEDRPIFRQGFCRTCFYETPTAGDWIMRPELSTAHLDKEDRDLEYEKKVQLQPHIVYLANSSNIKVGVTRKSQVPTRWIDQGAHEAIEIVEVPNRYLAGVTEVALKEHIGDKTNWRKMLTNEIDDEDLVEYRNKLKKYIPDEASVYYIESNTETHLEFPVLQYPKKVKSLNLDKTPIYSGVLKGIKGQYLIFEDSTVFNVRGSEGYVVSLEVK